MVIMMSLHIFSGLRLFCGSAYSKIGSSHLPIRASVDVLRTGDSDNEIALGQGNPQCSCKKQKKCTPTPRIIANSNTLPRFAQQQSEMRSERHHLSCSADAVHDFRTRGDPVLLTAEQSLPFSMASHVSQTCVLRI